MILKMKKKTKLIIQKFRISIKKKRKFQFRNNNQEGEQPQETKYYNQVIDK